MFSNKLDSKLKLVFFFVVGRNDKMKLDWSVCIYIVGLAYRFFVSYILFDSKNHTLAQRYITRNNYIFGFQQFPQ